MKGLKIFSLLVAMVLVFNIGAQVALASSVELALFESGTKREPLLSGAMSLVVPGLGQWYNGENQKAIWHGVAGLAGWILGGVLGLSGIGLLIPLAIAGYSAYDAYKTANEINTHFAY